MPAEAEGRRRGSGQAGHASGCRDPQARALLLPYALARCRDGEAFDFEVHLLACATCFADLKRLDRAGGLLQELMSADSPALDRVRDALRDEHQPAPAAPRRRSSPGTPGGGRAKPSPTA